MKREWVTTGVYIAITWIVYFVGEFSGSSPINFFATLGYFAALLAGAIALIVRLIMNLVNKKSVLPVLAMILAVLPFCFMLEIREIRARAQDFFLRDERMKIVEQVQSGALAVDEYGFAGLPEKWSHLSEDGDLHVCWDEDGAIECVEFYQFRAILEGAFSTVYCVDENSSPEEILSIDHIFSCKPLGDGWYYVSYD